MVAAKDEPRLIDLRHPSFSALTEDWILWRNVYESGRQFINRYLEHFSKREDTGEFDQRKKLSVPAGFASSAVDDVKNNIYQRMIDISRAGGSPSYKAAITGNDGGVDLSGSSMNYFIGQLVLPELLVMRRVGVYVDMPPIDGATLMEARQVKARPYIYLYKAEEICNWVGCRINNRTEFIQVLLLETYMPVDPKFGFPYKSETRYRYMYLNAEGYCVCEYYNMSNIMIDEYGNHTNQSQVLRLRRIPFYVFELPHSLLKDAAQYQIALMNIASSDINYILRANFPFYTEQQDWRANSPHTRPVGAGGFTNEGEAEGAKTAESREIETGVATGRVYGQGMERPGFIHPSPEPLQASMAKQEQLKKDIRQLINLAITNMVPTKQQSVDSKMMDNQGLEAGLAFIGMVLEKGERAVGELWAAYESEKAPTINYPRRYSLKSDTEIRAEIDHYIDILKRIPSLKAQKILAKLIARAAMSNKITYDEMEEIEKEIDKATFVGGDPKDIQKDVELGILDRANAALSQLYPKDAIEVANREHADRLQRIAENQATESNITNAAARGVPDLSVNAQGGSQEKAASRDNTTKAENTSAVRGAGKNNGANK